MTSTAWQNVVMEMHSIGDGDQGAVEGYFDLTALKRAYFCKFECMCGDLMGP